MSRIVSRLSDGQGVAPETAVGAGLPMPANDSDESTLFGDYLFPELAEWLPVLRRLSVSVTDAAICAAVARRNGTSFQAELLLAGFCGDDELYRAVSDELGLRYLASVDSARLVVTDGQALSVLRRRSWHIPIKIAGKAGPPSCVIAPERLEPAQLRTLLDRTPGVAARLRIAAPATLRAALSARLRPELARLATCDLADRFPSLSARVVANAWQGFIFGVVLVGLPVALVLQPWHSWTALHVFFSVFFLACVGLRLAALLAPIPRKIPIARVRAADLPVYSVLVALYKEAEIVPGLIQALGAIVWPKAKLEIKIVCEEDDRPTLEALAARPLPRSVEVVRVPRIGPRTKPKALAYALPLVSGEFVVLYDAEDVPNPLQLLQAWQAFQRTGPELACVQAPLEISNRHEGGVARMFAFEYAALFRGLLPWLAARRLLLPLGGTSNHFRRAALEHVGGWDPHNVTEDADLGLRLARFGYRIGTIDCPTYEPAPCSLGIWLPQRTRWFKGWLHP